MCPETARNRCVTISGLVARIARARRYQSRYGIFKEYLYRNLLWLRSNGKVKRIRYTTQIMPSWSWMAYNGSIKFIKIPFNCVDWNIELQFNKKHKHVFFNKKGKDALVTNIGVFQNYSLEQRNTSYAILDSSKAERGWIQYNIKASKDLQAKRYVVVGRESQGLRNKKYYILVIRPTSVDGEYTRVRVGRI